MEDTITSNMIKSIISYFLSIIGRIVPIKNNLFVFNSLPDMTDNAYALYLELTKRDDVELVWIVDDPMPFKGSCSDEHTRIVAKKSFTAIWLFLRARMVIVTHSLFWSFKNLRRDKIILNTGHGMPLKKIGLLDGKSWVPNLDYTISSSKVFQGVMSKCYGLPLNKVLLSGSPKCDLLFLPTDFYKNHDIDKSRYKKIGAWLPTYRATDKVFNRVDGNFDENKISCVSIQELEVLNTFLMDKECLLVIKLHPMDILQKKSFPSFSNIIILKQSDMKEQLYPFLGSTDFLLTDYSSVWVDYDVLNKPVGFVLEDLDGYTKDRGFTIPVEDVFPGQVILNVQDLMKYIDNPTRITKNIYNKYKDSSSSQRVLNMLKI